MSTNTASSGGLDEHIAQLMQYKPLSEPEGDFFLSRNHLQRRESKMTMNTCSSHSVPQDPSPFPPRTERGKFGDSGKGVLKSPINVSYITRMSKAGMAKEDKKNPDVILMRNILVKEETGNLRAIKAKKHLQREKCQSPVPDMADGVTLTLTPQREKCQNPVPDMADGVTLTLTPQREKCQSPVRRWSNINSDTTEGKMPKPGARHDRWSNINSDTSLLQQNKWYQINSEPLPNYVELADKFGQDAAFDLGNLF